MESTTEVVWEKEQKQSTVVSKKCVQEVSATSVQKLSTSSVSEQSVLSVLGSDGILTDGVLTTASPTVESPVSISSPIITSPALPQDGNTVNTASMQSEFSAMKLKDEQGNEIGEIVQEKQQQESVQASASVTSTDNGSKSISSSTTSSSMLQQSTSTMVADLQESSSSSNIIADKSVCVEDLPENTEKVDDQCVKTNEVENHTEQLGSDAAKERENEEFVEEIEDESDDGEDDEEGTHQTIKEEILDNPDGGQTKTLTVTTARNATPVGTKTKTVVTKSSVEKDQPVKETTIPKKLESEINTANESPIKKECNKDEETEEVTKEADEEGQEESVIRKVSGKDFNELKKSDDSVPQQLNTEKTPGDSQNQTPVKEETVVDAPSIVPQRIQQESTIPNTQDPIKEASTSLENGLRMEANIAVLKQREFELIQKQQELAKEIEYQKFLAQKLTKENEMKQQTNHFRNPENNIRPANHEPTTNVSSYSNFEETQDNNVYTRKSETFEARESTTNVTKKIDLNKIFTPATDAEEILPKNRKLYASSAFYSPTLHPTVEDQVELARRISHSLSDISNQQSRGQSMYVNRKKRSVKWVHESQGQDENDNVNMTKEEEYDQAEKENEEIHHDKVPLKFLMNPCGQMRDINSLRESINTETGLLSPDVSAEVVTALQTQKGKGAELFAKRRKVSEKWVVDESNVGAQSPSGLPDYQQYQQQPKPPTSPSILPAYTDVAKHRVQLNLHQEQLLEKYAKPSLKVVQTPWEAAITSGSASAAFVEEQKLSPYPASTPTPSLTPQLYDVSHGGLSYQSAPSTPNSYRKTYSTEAYQKFPMHTASQQQAPQERQQYTGTNAQRELAYKPSIPQGWKAPSMSLPKGPEDSNQRGVKLTANKTSQQHFTTVNEAVRSCEEFNRKDEAELIDLIGTGDVKAVASNAQYTKDGHEFVNHLLKSPQLRLSPIPIRTQVIYDNAVQELHTKQLRELQDLEKKMSSSSYATQSKNVKEPEEKVNVRKQLQQYEDLYRQQAKQIEEEAQLQKQRVAAKMKASQYNNRKLEVGGAVNSKATGQQIIEPENCEEYIKVPVRELITNFEQHCLQEEKPNMQPAHNTASSNPWKSRHSETEPQVAVTADYIKPVNEDLYMPKEIPLQSYAPPPLTAIPPAVSSYTSNAAYEAKPFATYEPFTASLNETAPAMVKSYGGNSTFPVSKPHQQGFSSTYGYSQPPRQQYLPPESYKKVPQNSSQNVPQVNFNPSPLPYEKLAKFENPPADEGPYINSPTSRGSHLNVRASKVRNMSPAAFDRSYTPSSDNYLYGGTPSVSPRPLSSNQQYQAQNISNSSYSSAITNKILYAPTYNTPARGWGCNGGAYSYAQNHIKPQIVNASGMPYTDF